MSVWLPPDADLDRAIELIADEEAGVSASVAETDKEGVRLSATTWADEPRASAAGRPPSCARAGCVCCASTVYPQPRPERGPPPNFYDPAAAKVEEA